MRMRAPLWSTAIARKASPTPVSPTIAPPPIAPAIPPREALAASSENAFTTSSSPTRSATSARRGVWPGGSIDMMRGAALSTGGRSVIALKSSAKGGQVSCITLSLPANTATTVLRTDVDYVVTEYGARRIRHLPLRARAEALIEIAHPDFRDHLRDAWKEMNRI